MSSRIIIIVLLYGLLSSCSPTDTTPPAPPDPPAPQRLTFYCKNNTVTDWTALRCFYWEADTTPAGNSWPGTAMAAATGGWYHFSITNATHANVIFNNGASGAGSQTADLFHSGDGWFVPTGTDTAGKLTGVWYDTNPDTANPPSTATAESGADGVFTDITVAGRPLHQATGSPGAYQRYMYFHGGGIAMQPFLYVEIDYVDNGVDRLQLQYNAAGDPYRTCTHSFNAGMTGSGEYRTAVFRLSDPLFSGAMNLGADFRLMTSGQVQMQIGAVRIYGQPSCLYTAWNTLGPYSGPVYSGANPVDTASLTGKILTGYQGWFRTPGDPEGYGWKHYSSSRTEIYSGSLTVDLWPDMAEYTKTYPAGAFSYPDGTQATLFSSADPETVDLHFTWMAQYGIDTAAVQRFGTTISADYAPDSYRILTLARNAANKTGRAWYVHYDLGNMDTNTMVETLSNDWHFLVTTLQMTGDDRYQRHGGLPVVGVYGFFTNRFSAATANRILDIFQSPGPRQAFVVGSGAHWWRSITTDGWPEVYARMGAYIPWNVGNKIGTSPVYARTTSWSDDLAAMQAGGRLFIPLVYPGFSWDNLKNYVPGTSLTPRLDGGFLWEQVKAVHGLGLSTIYVAMFDELDEGTAIFKVANTIPIQGYFVSNGGLATDFYLLLTGYAGKTLRGEVPYQDTVPTDATMRGALP